MRTVLSLVLLMILVRVSRPARPLCGNVAWLPFEDAESFGYAEWFCDRPAGHPGDHAGYLS